jgi:methylase of polypeptide subunit release factors
VTIPEVMSFGHLDIQYDPAVLKPRPWTEEQSAWAAKLLDELPAGDVLELCAGVGQIGLLAVSGTSRHLVQVDADARACELARANAATALGTGGAWSVEVRQRSLDSAVRPGEPFVLVIADPPWVRSEDVGSHPDDPTSAIDGGVDGLEAVRACLEIIGVHLTDDGAAVLQVADRSQVEAVREHVDRRPHLRLTVVDHRVLPEGALVHLTRGRLGRAGCMAGDAEG